MMPSTAQDGYCKDDTQVQGIAMRIYLYGSGYHYILRNSPSSSVLLRPGHQGWA